MRSSIKTRIVKIGNSRGIRTPKLLLDQAALSEEGELDMRDGQIVIRPPGQASARGMGRAIRQDGAGWG